MTTRAFARRVLHFFFPPRCVLCQEETQEARQLCAPCWSKITFITDPQCHSCGLPFEVPPLETPAFCAPCLTQPPRYSCLRAAFAYDDVSKPLLMRFKHGDATHLTPLLVEWLSQGALELKDKIDVIVPVPLYWTRLVKRQYNQAALLAQALAQKWDKPYASHGLQRLRKTPPQGRLSPQARADNVRGAFYGRPEVLKGQRVLLVDDVMTTGATLESCAKALQKAGATVVHVATLARVVRPRFLGKIKN